VNQWEFDPEPLLETPGGAELVPQKTIEESRAANLKDVLDFVPGVLIRPRYSTSVLGPPRMALTQRSR